MKPIIHDDLKKPRIIHHFLSPIPSLGKCCHSLFVAEESPYYFHRVPYSSHLIMGQKISHFLDTHAVESASMHLAWLGGGWGGTMLPKRVVCFSFLNGVHVIHLETYFSSTWMEPYPLPACKGNYYIHVTRHCHLYSKASP